MPEFNGMLAADTADNRILFLLDSIKKYLDRVDRLNNNLYHTMSVIRYNMSKLNMLSTAEANTYKYKALNYLERLYHSLVWRYGNLTT